ncbi:MAG: Gfo/Idh/MocA family oxidoreductase [Fibrobacteres bacterium]|nr:Gfo/Idh/MocA family oxidoreductase [Fibrobacterota bacterium]
MKKIGALVVGPGWVSGEHIKGYIRDGRAEVRSIACARKSSSQLERANAIAEKFSLKNVRIESDWKSAMDAPDIDAVSVCSISHHHFEIAEHALKLGKHLLVEKPVCFTEKELGILEKLHREAKTKFAVCHVVRYYPALRNIRKLLDKKSIGAPYYIEADYWHEVIGAWKCKKATAGSSLLMGGCHAVDMIYHMLGFDKVPVSVTALSTKAVRRKDFDYDPTVAGIIRFKSGEIAKVGSSLESALPYKFHLQIMGSRGAIVDNKLFKMKGNKKQPAVQIPGTYADDGDVAHHPFDYLVKGFVDSIVNNREPHSSFKEALKTYKTIFALEKSFKTGKTVTLKS